MIACGRLKRSARKPPAGTLTTESHSTMLMAEPAAVMDQPRSVSRVGPKLKVMAHHLGAMIPFFDERIETGWATLGSRTSGEDYSHVLPSLGKPLLDCFKDFYGDTALCGGRIGLVCGLDFYGVDHVLYASDAPFGPEGGAHYIRSQMAAVASLDIPMADKEKICSGNAVSFVGL